MDIVITDQSCQISAIITAWDEFEERCFKYFSSDEPLSSEASISHTFSMIKLLKDRLDHLRNELRTYRARCDGQESASVQWATLTDYNNWFQSLWR